MGGKKKRSRSRDRSEERSNSKRLRKLEDMMSGMLSSIASIQQAITTKDLPASSEVDYESVGDKFDEGENGNRDPVFQVEEKINDIPASKVVKEPEVPEVLNDVTNKQPPVNSEKTVPVVTIDESETQIKEAEAEVPWVLEKDALRIF
ncbi:uncharacterized protein LOC123260599 [Cotesia glomerata]|uniref:Uncharacterized protein n=1 Tax=Cotesia glomerata TaxID=32391 RepID=A0AAV7IB42_COTGL|nr:uncharacterized protein LOC123260599 [Cotesia glomerata]KAH0549980.1 hypothetical protein KQX54_016669 [Cotesia glomerata]